MTAHPDPTGGLLYNETSFKIEQQSWGTHRNHRPIWGYQWKPGSPRTSPPKPGYMKWDGKVVLDPCDNPVRDHKNIPLTLSSQLPGCKMQWMKMENDDIKQIDCMYTPTLKSYWTNRTLVWARMPRNIPKGGRQTGTKPLSKINTMVNMHMQRFREKQGCLSWSQREGSDNIEGNSTRLFKYYGFDPVSSGNSTMGFGRDLAPWESELVKLTNLGTAPKRSGKKALDKWTRYKTQVTKMQKIEAKNKALYLAVMAVPAPTLDYTRNPDYKKGDEEDFEVEEVGRRPREKVQGQKRQSTEDTEDEGDLIGFDGEETDESDAENDEDPVIIRGQRRSSGANKAVRTNRKQDQDATKPAGIPSEIEGFDQYATLPGQTSSRPHSDGLQQSNAALDASIGGYASFLGIPHGDDLHAHRKRTRQFLGEDEEGEYQPPTKRLHITEDGTAEEIDASGVDERIPNHKHLGNVLAEQVVLISATWNPVVDYTTVAPTNEQEMMSIEKALQLTRDAYLELVGIAVPYTDRRDSYADQWQRIFDSFVFDWSMKNTLNQYPPYLFQLSPWNWGQSLTDWINLEDILNPLEGNEGQLAPENLAPEITVPHVNEPETTITDGLDDVHQAAPSDEAESESTESDTEKDYREVRPANEQDCHNIERVLKITRHAFLKYTGIRAPYTSRWASYADQCEAILAASETWWATERPEDEKADDMPLLPQWGAREFLAYMRALMEEAAEVEEEEEL